MSTQSPQFSASGRYLCRLGDIADGGARLVHVERDEPWELVLLRRGDRVFGYHNVCGHQQRNMDYLPGKFLVQEGRIICAVHGASFDVESGVCCGGPASSDLKSVSLRVVAGDVWLEDEAPEE